ETVASLDADCTYEPTQLLSLLKLLTEGVDVVVASPYHPGGKVVGVPRWRLALSRLASRLYGLVMRNQLDTYTSCVRIYRRSSVAKKFRGCLQRLAAARSPAPRAHSLSNSKLGGLPFRAPSTPTPVPMAARRFTAPSRQSIPSRATKSSLHRSPTWGR